MRRDNKSLRATGRASAIGWEIAIAVVAGLALGWWVDSKLGTSPWLTLLGLGLGCAVAARSLVSMARQLTEAAEEEDRAEKQKPDRGGDEP